MKTTLALAIGMMMSGISSAQTLPRQSPGQVAAAATMDKYQIGVMESVLQRAAEHGAKVTRDRVQAVIPMDMLLSDDVHVRGFRLDGYGVFFYIDMPDLQESTSWIYQTLDQNNLGLASAMREIRSYIESGGNVPPPNVQQALQRAELQVPPASQAAPAATPTAGVRSTVASSQTLTGSAANVTTDRAPAGAVDPVIKDPQSVYRAEVTDAVIDAILNHSSGLRLAATDQLTVAVRGKENPVRLSQADTESPTITISIKGEDLSALLANQITRDEAVKRVVVKQN